MKNSTQSNAALIAALTVLAQDDSDASVLVVPTKANAERQWELLREAAARNLDAEVLAITFNQGWSQAYSAHDLTQARIAA